MSEEEQATILQPVGYSSSRCGYCVSTSGHKKTGKPSKSYGIWAHSLSPTISAELLLLGWRRSGKYLYKPDQRSTCCQQFTISLRAEEFRSTKSQRNALKAFANYIVFGAGVKEGTRGWGIAREGLEEVGEESKERGKASTSKLESRDEGKEKDERPKKGAKGEGKQKTLSEAIHEPEWINSPTSKPFAHKFEYSLEPASFTEEKYALFELYQTETHHQTPDEITRKGFTRFLIDSPMEIEGIPFANGLSYGSHHALYRIDGHLVALCVIDILPGAISSVYAIMDPRFHALGLGKVSALREILMTSEYKAAGAQGMERYLMGFYIHSCPKMKYKGEYQPSELLDPETNTFYPWSHVKPILDAHPHASFSRAQFTSPPRSVDVVTEEDDDESDDEELPFPSPPPPGFLDPITLPVSIIQSTLILQRNRLVPFPLSAAWKDKETKREVLECVAALGDTMKGRVYLHVG